MPTAAPKTPDHKVSSPAKPLAGSAPRLHFIDGLRGVAMLMVLLFHCWIHGGGWRVDLPMGHHVLNLAALLSFGYTGVHLFLVLSGFCLYWPFVKEGGGPEPTLGKFAKKRCRRILPPYYVALVIFGGASLAAGLLHHDPAQVGFSANWLWLHALMLHNTQPAYILSLDPPLWSLALEFQLYILFPVFVEAYRRLPAAAVLLATLAACAAFRGTVAHALAPLALDDQAVFMQSVFSRCFEFVLGMYAARFVADWHVSGQAPVRRMQPALILGGFALLAIWDARALHLGIVADAKWGLFYAVLLVAASRPAFFLHHWLSARWLVACGIFSYSVYLIHEPCVLGLRSLAEAWHFTPAGTAWLLITVAAPLLVGLGYLFHVLFEKPFMTAPPTREITPALVPMD